MTSSKIFLGLTTCVLGVAAFAASRAKFTHNTFFTKLKSSTCKSEGVGARYYTLSPTSISAPTGVYATSTCVSKTYELNIQ
jgi:hypothetical protein